jgi:hypothetical protein
MAKCKNCTRLYRAYDEEDEVLVGKFCEKIFDHPDVEVERDCIFFNPMTNGDRIRRMTDEELAKFISGIDHDYDDGEYVVWLEGDRMNDNSSDILEWLKREE